jgi:hypothetical protein
MDFSLILKQEANECHDLMNQVWERQLEFNARPSIPYHPYFLRVTQSSIDGPALTVSDTHSTLPLNHS